MTKLQVYFKKEEAQRLRKIAKGCRRGVTDLVREAVRKTWLRDESIRGPVGLWDKETAATSVEHDSIYDEP